MVRYLCWRMDSLPSPYSLKDKSAPRVALGFDSPFFVDSTRRLAAQAKAHKMITTKRLRLAVLFILLDGHGQAASYRFRGLRNR